MQKNKIIKIFFSSLAFGVLFFADLSASSAAVNYGTTTYFSDPRQNATPPVSTPILDSGGRVPNWRPDKDNNDNSDDEGSEESIFDKIADKFQTLFGSEETDQFGSEEEGSLFDFQDGDGGDDYSEEYLGEYIMGPRGESIENLDEEEVARYQSRFAQGFSFGEGKDVAPKKSKLLFTNVEIPVDLTTQYVLIGIVFFLAIGASVGYYFWKRESKNENMKYNREDE